MHARTARPIGQRACYSPPAALLSGEAPVLRGSPSRACAALWAPRVKRLPRILQGFLKSGNPICCTATRMRCVKIIIAWMACNSQASSLSVKVEQYHLHLACRANLGSLLAAAVNCYLRLFSCLVLSRLRTSAIPAWYNCRAAMLSRKTARLWSSNHCYTTWREKLKLLAPK